MENADYCLVPVYLQIMKKGNLSRHAMICIPQTKDITSKDNIMEPQHEDQNTRLRKQKRFQHHKLLKQMRKKRLKLRKNTTMVSLGLLKNSM